MDELENYELSKEDIKKHLNEEERTMQIGLDEIIDKTIDYLNLSMEMLRSRNKNNKISIAKRVIRNI